MTEYYTGSKKKIELLKELEYRLQRCNLCFTREERMLKLTFPGVGNVDCTHMFIGEAPSIYRTWREHFTMKSKPIFDEILRIIGVDRSDVYITNVIKCIIYSSRTGESEKCRRYLPLEIEIVDPPVVWLLGLTAIRSVLNLDSSEIRYRIGRPLIVSKRIFVPLYHPMVCVYNPGQKDWYFSKVRQAVKLVNSYLF